MLVDEHTKNARLAQKGQRSLKTRLAIEGLNAQPAAVAIHQIIEQFVVEGLIDGAEVGLGNLKNQLSVEFPVADVIDCQKHRTAVGDIFG
jgi:hypothetical protein